MYLVSAKGIKGLRGWPSLSSCLEVSSRRRILGLLGAVGSHGSQKAKEKVITILDYTVVPSINTCALKIWDCNGIFLLVFSTLRSQQNVGSWHSIGYHGMRFYKIVSLP